MSFNENPVVRYIYQVQGATNSIPMARLAAPDLRMLLELSDVQIAEKIAGKRAPMYGGGGGGDLGFNNYRDDDDDDGAGGSDDRGAADLETTEMFRVASAPLPDARDDSDDDVMPYDPDAVKASAPGGGDWSTEFEKFRRTRVDMLRSEADSDTEPPFKGYKEDRVPLVRPRGARPGTLEEGAPYLGVDNQPLIVTRNGVPILFNREGTPLPKGPDGEDLLLNADGTPVAYRATDIALSLGDGEERIFPIDVSNVIDPVRETVYLAKRSRLRDGRKKTRREDRFDEQVEADIGRAERERLEAEITALTTAAARKALFPQENARPRTLDSVMRTQPTDEPNPGGIFSAEIIMAQEAAMQKVHALVRGPVRKAPTFWHFILANDSDVVSLFAQLVARHIGRADNLNPKQVRLAATYQLNEEHLAGILDQLNAYDFYIDDNNMPTFTPYEREDVWDDPHAGWRGAGFGGGAFGRSGFAGGRRASGRLRDVAYNS